MKGLTQLLRRSAHSPSDGEGECRWVDWSGGAPAASLEPRGSRYWQRRGRGAAGILRREMSTPRDSPGRRAPVRGLHCGGSFQPGIPRREMSTPRDSPGRRAPVRGPPLRRLLASTYLLGVPSRCGWGSLRLAPGEGQVPPPRSLPRLPLWPHSRMNMLATPIHGEGVLIAAETSLWQLRPTG